jgi:hypothetical protein
LTPSKTPPNKRIEPDANVSATPLITGGEHSPTEFLDSYLDVKETRLKYPSLQSRGLIYATLDDATVNQIIEVLEKTGWNQSDFTRFVFINYFYQTKVGLFTFFSDVNNRKLLESDDINDLRYIRDNLKNVVPGLMRITAETLATFRRPSNSK